MNKWKVALMILAYLAMVIISLPAMILLLIGAIVIYGALWLEAEIVCEIWDEDLTDSWNKFVMGVYGMLDQLKEAFLFEMEL